MKILFINTHFFMPQSYGGMSVTLHQLAAGLKCRGHSPVVLSGFRRGGTFGLAASAQMKARRLLNGIGLSRDNRPGYPVWRSWDPVSALGPVAYRERPDIIVIMGGKVVPAWKAAKATSIPVLIQVHDVEEHFHAGDFAEVAAHPLIANSRFTADFYRRRFGASGTVIYPFIDRHKYQTLSKSGDAVVFINPYRRKGILPAIETAEALPGVPFLFVGALEKNDPEAGVLADRMARLPNIERLPQQSDMRRVYERARLILMPSQWEEAFGRVASEAHLSGIPVVGSDRGGLPESIGDGGIVIAHDAPGAAWAEAVGRLWQDPVYYAKMSAAAHKASLRPELQTDYQLAAHEQSMEACIRSFGGQMAPAPISLSHAEKA